MICPNFPRLPVFSAVPSDLSKLGVRPEPLETAAASLGKAYSRCCESVEAAAAGKPAKPADPWAPGGDHGRSWMIRWAGAPEEL